MFFLIKQSGSLKKQIGMMYEDQSYICVRRDYCHYNVEMKSCIERGNRENRENIYLLPICLGDRKFSIHF